MPTEMLHVEERNGGLLHLTLNRPRQHNALSFELLDRLRETLESHSADEALKCVVITGAGEKSFCAGGDLHELDSMRSLDDAREISRIGRRALDAVRYFPVPVAAALNGDALGGGAELAIACDFCLAARHARLGFLQARLNLMTAWGGGADVLARCGNAKGMNLLLQARRMSAGEAHQAGLIDEIGDDGQSAGELAQVWSDAMMQRSRAVLCGQKDLAIIARRQMHEALSDAEEQHMARAWTDPAHWEAVRQSFSTKKT